MTDPASGTDLPHHEHYGLFRAEDRRSTDRFGVEFRTVVSDKSGINDQVGMILDLSLSGCQVQVPILVYPTLVMEVRICAPNLDPPIFVERAVVVWVKGDRFGLHFVLLGKTELIRLAEVVAALGNEQQQQC